MPPPSPATDGNLALFACPNPQCDTFNRFDAFMMTVGRSKAVLFAPEPDNLETAQHWTVYGRVKVDWKGQNPYHNWWDTDMQIAGLRA